MNTTLNPDRQYLQAALEWLDARLSQEVQRWLAAGRDPANRFRGLYVSDRDALSLTGLEPSGEQETANPTDETDRCSGALEKMHELEAQARDSDQVLSLQQLVATFGLSEFEWQALVICAAPALDLRYERIYSYLQDDVTRTAPTVDLILNLLMPGERLARLEGLKYFDRLSTLRHFRLITPLEEQGKSPNLLRLAFHIAPGVMAWLIDIYSPTSSLGDWAEIYVPPQEVDEQEEAAAVFENKSIPQPDVLESIHPFVSLCGKDQIQQELIVRKIATALGRTLLKIKIIPGETAQDAIEKLYQAVRDARMTQSLLFVQGGDLLIDIDGNLLPESFEALRMLEDSVFIGSQVVFKFNPDMPGNDTSLMYIHLEELATSERIELWQLLLDGATQDLSQVDIPQLAGQFSLTSGQIVAAASTAMSAALQNNRPLEDDDLFAAARLHSGHHLAELAHKIEPRYTWDDLVLPETPISMLREMVNMVKSRSLVLDEWGLGLKLTSGSGVSVLFSGPPGTGKTLAAQIMAHQLGIDLYRIDLSTVVSKYIGETEKNLERIFNDASHSNAILFFDEADTIFGKRSEVKDAHDRYANIEVGYLLQRMESYAGLAILATNLRANLDEAFTRRLQFIVNFPFPDEEYRLRIWKVLMPENLPCDNNLDLVMMAKRFKLAGGSIRNIIVSAAYTAAADGGKVTMAHLMHGAKREFQKMGKLLHEADFAL